MTVEINGVVFVDVYRCGFNNCEVSLVFNPHHSYSFSEWIHNIIEAGFTAEINYRFKGVEAWYINDEDTPFDEDGETAFIAVIPEDTRDMFKGCCW